MPFIFDIALNKLENLKKIAQQLSKNPTLFNNLDKTIWQIIRNYEEMPTTKELQIIYQEEVFKILEDQILKKAEELNISLVISYDKDNITNTSFFVNGKSISNLKELEEVMTAKAEEKQSSEDKKSIEVDIETILNSVDYSFIEAIKERARENE